MIWILAPEGFVSNTSCCVALFLSLNESLIPNLVYPSASEVKILHFSREKTKKKQKFYGWKSFQVHYLQSIYTTSLLTDRESFWDSLDNFDLEACFECARDRERTIYFLSVLSFQLLLSQYATAERSINYRTVSSTRDPTIMLCINREQLRGSKNFSKVLFSCLCRPSSLTNRILIQFSSVFVCPRHLSATPYIVTDELPTHGRGP